MSAAITLARAGVAVTVFEAAATVGGGARTAELTLPGFRHDVGSSVYPMGVASPFFRELPLERFRLPMQVTLSTGISSPPTCSAKTTEC